jgi:DNA-binding transcriptional regulator LsrR (DeoR family)
MGARRKRIRQSERNSNGGTADVSAKSLRREEGDNDDQTLQAKRARRTAGVYTASTLENLAKYLAGEASAETCAENLQTSKQTFFNYLRNAYQQGFLRLRAPVDVDETAKLGNFFRAKRLWTTAFVLKGQPDQAAFASGAGERLLEIFLRKLYEEKRKTLVIGIIGGSSVAAAIDQMLNERLWEETFSPQRVVPPKCIYILGLNNTPSWGDDLITSSGVIVATMARALGKLFQAKLANDAPFIFPVNLSSELLIADDDDTLRKTNQNAANSAVVALADPHQLAPPHQTDRALDKTLDRLEQFAAKYFRKDPKEFVGTLFARKRDFRLGDSFLDLVITSVGAKDKSVYREVLKAEDIDVPDDFVGDVCFTGINSNGTPISLKISIDGEEQNGRLYSAFKIEQLQKLAESGQCDVVMIARNLRRDQSADKTAVMRAAIVHRFVNSVITDAYTSEQLRGGSNDAAAWR